MVSYIILTADRRTDFTLRSYHPLAKLVLIDDDVILIQIGLHSEWVSFSFHKRTCRGNI